MKQSTDFTEGKILLPLIKFSIPILLAVFLQAMYGAVDLLVVGQFGDASSVSAVSTGSQIIRATSKNKVPLVSSSNPSRFPATEKELLSRIQDKSSTPVAKGKCPFYIFIFAL